MLLCFKVVVGYCVHFHSVDKHSIIPQPYSLNDFQNSLHLACEICIIYSKLSQVRNKERLVANEDFFIIN